MAQDTSTQNAPATLLSLAMQQASRLGFDHPDVRDEIGKTLQALAEGRGLVGEPYATQVATEILGALGVSPQLFAQRGTAPLDADTVAALRQRMGAPDASHLAAASESGGGIDKATLIAAALASGGVPPFGAGGSAPVPSPDFSTSAELLSRARSGGQRMLAKGQAGAERQLRQLIGGLATTTEAGRRRNLASLEAQAQSPLLATGAQGAFLANLIDAARRSL